MRTRFSTGPPSTILPRSPNSGPSSIHSARPRGQFTNTHAMKATTPCPTFWAARANWSLKKRNSAAPLKQASDQLRVQVNLGPGESARDGTARLRSRRDGLERRVVDSRNGRLGRQIDA